MSSSPRYRLGLRYLLIVLGGLSVVAAALGVVIPGLPTTPFVLLASWCFYKSSPRLQAWLLQSFLGHYIRDYQRRGGITTRKRIYIILLMVAMVSISIIFFIQSTTLRIVVAAAAFIGCIVVGCVLPKAKNDSH